MNVTMRRRSGCRLCGSSRLEKGFSLTPTPPANAFVPQAALSTPQITFPLDVYLCLDCGHLQLIDVIDPRVLFEHYVYVSGTSPSFVAHFQSYAEQTIEQLGLKPGDLVVDVGSNDGTLLSFFKEAGMRVIGIDPAIEVADLANKKGIDTINDFFTASLARDIVDKHGPAALITANNVFAHADDLQGILEAVRCLLSPSGAFVFEVSYLVDVYQNVLFDTIYHEHLDYHRVEPIRRFFKRNDMILFDSQRVSSHGGSLRGYAALAESGRSESANVSDLIKLEQQLKLGAIDTYREFAQQIDRRRLELTALIRGLKDAGKKIAAYGAPAKATTFMYHFGLGADVIDFIVDDSPLKQGLYSPGLHIPVLPAQAMYDKRPDYVVVLAWNFADAIIQKHVSFSIDGGRFIVPFPNLKVE
jgi:SAM-dependent methyltransferase